MKIPKVVLDTNLFIAAYWKRHSASAGIISACLEGNLRACYTPRIEKEMWTVLRAIRAKEEYVAMVRDFLDRAERVDPWAQVDVVSADPDDQKFLVCAASANADYLITSDDHLLTLGRVGETEIITPGSFWRSYHADRGIPEES